MHWILVYNALFFFDFLFNRIVPNLYISNAGLGTKLSSENCLAFLFLPDFPTLVCNSSTHAENYIEYIVVRV